MKSLFSCISKGYRLITFLPVILYTSISYAQTAAEAINYDSSSFYLEKSRVEKQAGHYLPSLKLLEKATQLNPNNLKVLVELADMYHILNRYPQSRETYMKLITLGDTSIYNYRKAMMLSFQIRQFEDVIFFAYKLKTASPEENVTYILGKAAYELEDYELAIGNLIEAGKNDPGNAEIPYLIGRSYADMMNYKLAISNYLKAIGLDTTKNLWAYELGLIYYAIHDDKNALKYILLAGERGYKKDNDYLENLGIAYLNTGNLNQGITILDEILKKKPGDINLLNMIAEACYENKKFKLAIDYWDRILYHDKANASALYMIGMCYIKTGEKQKGITLCDKAIEIDPTLAGNKRKMFNSEGL